VALTATLVANLEKGLAAKRQIRARATSDRVDLGGDRIDPAGIDLADFLKNPVVLWAHDHGAPIARVVSVDRSAHALDVVIQFPEPGVSPKADEVFGLIQAGAVNALSVGLLVDEIETEDA